VILVGRKALREDTRGFSFAQNDIIGRMKNLHKSTRPNQVMAWALAFVICGYLIAVISGSIKPEHRLAWPEFGLVSLVFLIATGITHRLVDIAVGKDGVKLTLQHVADIQEEHGKEIDELRKLQEKAIDVLLKVALPRTLLEKLRGLAASGPFLVTYRPYMFRELEHLDSIDFVKPVKADGLVAIRDAHEKCENDQFDLKEFVRLERDGQNFLQLLDALLVQRQYVAGQGSEQQST
jgi:hypothetical protein